MTAPFSLNVEGVAHATGTGGTDPTELESAAQPVIHRPTGACNTTRIIPPSRLCTGEFEESSCSVGHDDEDGSTGDQVGCGVVGDGNDDC